MPSIRIYMDTIEKQNLRRRNIIGGGKQIVSSINCPLPRIILVWSFFSRRIITLPKISYTFLDWWNVPVNTLVKDATSYPWAPISKLIIILPTSAERWETRAHRTNHANHSNRSNIYIYISNRSNRSNRSNHSTRFIRSVRELYSSFPNKYMYNWNSIAIHCFSWILQFALFLFSSIFSSIIAIFVDCLI